LSTVDNKLVIHSEVSATIKDDGTPNTLDLKDTLNKGLIVGDFAERWVKFNGKFIINPTHATVDETYTKQVVAREDGTIGFKNSLNLNKGSDLPITGMKEGDIFFNTTDKKHYSYNGTAWNATSDKQDRLQDITSYIGVGKTDASATEKLDVNGNIKATGFIITNGTATQALTANEEARLVNADYVKNKNTYNIAYGGNSSERLDVVTVKDKEGNTFAVNKYDERLLNGELVGIMKGTPMSEEAKAKLSKAVEGKIWINKDEKNIRVWPNELEHYLSLGWIKGRTFHARKPHSEETRALIGKANSLCTRSKEYKENISEQFKNRIWISKEKESKFIDKSELNFYISNEWKIGRSPFKWKKNR
jgi:hypothetical protein